MLHSLLLQTHRREVSQPRVSNCHVGVTLLWPRDAGGALVVIFNAKITHQKSVALRPGMGVPYHHAHTIEWARIKRQESVVQRKLVTWRLLTS
jgi:hypothetical protein